MTESDIALVEMVLDRELVLRGESIEFLPETDSEAYHLLVAIFGMNKRTARRFPSERENS